MLSGFDPKSVEVASPRGPRFGRDGVASVRTRARKGAPAPDRQGHQHPRQDVFVNLGGKSEGIISVDQFDGKEVPSRAQRSMSSSIGSTRRRRLAPPPQGRGDRGRLDEPQEGRGRRGPRDQGHQGGRRGRRQRHPRLHADQPDRPVAGRGRGELRQSEVQGDRHRGQPREKNLVVSRRDLLEQERAEQREKTWATLEEGQVREGVVRSVKDFGAFVDLGGVDGLLPIGEMSWSRVAKVDELVKIGDKVTVKVLKIDRTTRSSASA